MNKAGFTCDYSYARETCVLKLKGLSFGYDADRLLIKACSKDFNSRLIYGIYGSSGAGKSSFARVLAGYHTPLSGTISLVCGNTITLLPTRPHPVGIISQNPELDFDARITLQKSFAVFGHAPTEDLCATFGLEAAWLKRKPTMLSGGQLQRCNIVRTLMLKPSFVIADEISTMLDAISQAELFRSLLEVRKRDKFGLIVMSHDRKLLDLVCDCVLDFSSLSNMC